MAGLCEGGNEPPGSLKAVSHDEMGYHMDFSFDVYDSDVDPVYKPDSSGESSEEDFDQRMRNIGKIVRSQSAEGNTGEVSRNHRNKVGGAYITEELRFEYFKDLKQLAATVIKNRTKDSEGSQLAWEAFVNPTLTDHPVSTPKELDLIPRQVPDKPQGQESHTGVLEIHTTAKTSHQLSSNYCR
ncbi:hypothetical protein ANN_04482 [Periplaneta americana]|uniref:Uncharacterized protein n=1 Tax=Periplaneta americana TaxID=6978 RepID=A0ABQ8T8P5_PERAM|nr:hypothetical protein ANN_04482 [Periplaneta americana]